MTRGLCLPLLLLAFPAVAPAQLISIRTVPVAQSDQFDIYPSHNLAMGGISFALPDALRDPFVNPATGARLVSARILGSPLVFRVTGDAGAGRTLPLAALARVGSWFGGAMFALQQVDPSNRTASPIPVQRFDLIAPVPLEPRGRSRNNEYAFASLGRTLGAGISLAVSARWAGLQIVDGVDLLYATSMGLEPSRVATTAEPAGQSCRRGGAHHLAAAQRAAPRVAVAAPSTAHDRPSSIGKRRRSSP